MPKNHHVFDYDYGSFARLVREAMDTLCLTRNRLGILSTLNTRTLDRVLAGQGVNERVRQNVLAGLRAQREKTKGTLDLAPLAAAAHIGPLLYTRRQALRLATTGLAVLTAEAGLGGPALPWRQVLNEGVWHASRQEFAEADAAFDRADRLAPTSEASALALSHRAWVALEDESDDSWEQVRPLVASALNLLHMADIRPDQGPSIATVEERIKRAADPDTALTAYTALARVQGLFMHLASRFAAARTAYATYGALAELLGDRPMLIEAWHLGAKAELEVASRSIRRHGPEWRTLLPNDRAARTRVGISLRQLERAYSLCLAEQAGLWQAQTERVIARAQRLAGTYKAAAAADSKAERLYGTHVARMNLLIDRGRNLAADGAPETLPTLDAAQQFALHTGSDSSVAAILGVKAAYQADNQKVDEAKVLCAAALLAWPRNIDTRDSIKSVWLFQDLGMVATDLHRFLDLASTPRWILEQSPRFKADIGLDKASQRLTRNGLDRSGQAAN